MASSKLAIDKRNKLYFNKFKYRAKLKLHGVGYTYYTSDIDTYINRIDRFKSQEQTWLSVNVGLWAKISYDLIEKYMDYRNNMDKDKMSSRIDGDTVSFFSNDISLFDPLYNIDPNLTLSEAKVLKTDTIYLKKQPKHKFRTYFRGKRMPQDFPENVINFINTYKDVSVSPGLERFVYSRSSWHKFVYLHSSYHVDYDSESTITLLHMVFGNMIGKTYSLDKEP